MKVTPVSETSPSLRMVARGVNQLHACLDDHRTKTETALEDHGTDIKAIKSALRIGEKGQTLATMRPLTAFLQQTAAIAGGGAGLIFAYKLILAAWPAIWAFLKALNHAVLTTA